MSSTVKIENIGQIALAVSDIKAAIAFYQDSLELELLFEVPSGLAFFQVADTRLMLTTLQGSKKDHHSSVIYYKVNDIKKAQLALEKKGVVFERVPQLAAKMSDHELWIGFLRDPDDNLIGIMSEVR
jgi:catechol 2,3-dioxygenase-like lactoylglutathione lyase family enzyme